MEYAGVARRFVAVVIDGFVFVAISMVTGLLGGGAYSTSTASSYNAGVQIGNGPMLVALVLFFAYYVICEGFFGRTLGKRLLGLRVVAEDGSPIYLGAAFLRNLLRIVDAFFFYLVAAVSVWASPKRQRLGDRAARTFVVLDSGSTKTEWGQPPAHRGVVPTYSEDDFRSDLARAERFKSTLARSPGGRLSPRH
jgi:uncharacterized RDD family membrane protein YckC